MRQRAGRRRRPTVGLQALGPWGGGQGRQAGAGDAQRGGGGDLYADEEARQRALRYSRTRQWLVLAGLLWSGLTSTAALATGLSAWLRDRAEQAKPRRWGPQMHYTVAASVLSFVA